MRAIKFGGLVVMLLASTVMAQTDGTVQWNARAVIYDKDFVPIPQAQWNDLNLDVLSEGGTKDIYMQWTVSAVVTGNNQGLGGCLVSMGVQDVNDIGTGTYAPIVQDAGSLSFPAIYKAPGTGSNGGVDAAATAGGPGAGAGAQKGSPSGTQFYVDQMGMGYLAWSARRYKTTPPPPGWVGDQQWGVGLASRKSVLLMNGDDGTYDLVEGWINLTPLRSDLGTYRSVFDLPVMQSSVLNTGQNLNTDQLAVDMTTATIQAGDSFEFTVTPEPASLLLLAGAGLLVRRRRA